MNPIASLEPSRKELLQIIERAKESGHLPEDFVGRELAAIRGRTGEKALATSTIERKKELSPEESARLLETLRGRFEKNKILHPETQWAAVEKSLQARPDLVWSLQRMEETGGEPDVFMDDKDAFVFGDCSAESPAGRRNCVYDKAAEEGLREVTFAGNAVDMAAEMGVDLMDEAQYCALQELTSIDAKTYSWLKKPANVRKSGRKSGRAPFGCRSGSAFIVSKHLSYIHIDSMGFRAVLRVPKVA